MENITVDIESRPLQELTLGDIIPYFRKMIVEEVENINENIPVRYSGIDDEITEKILKDPARYAYGLAGFAKVLHCCRRTANKYKQSGDYDKAIIRFGNRLVFDKVKVLEIAQKLGKETIAEEGVR